ncbi:hypothetical protein [Lentibacillus sp. Marseille-P4043]|uniref:hypothetical protein n=1 Tax=Lentibacillus sp. Marseille-P4043 TaxID=2040293 RepID=UPI00131A5126|nr:hypothetical protein [Lentibacillus sp. Marseille-P4043]
MTVVECGRSESTSRLGEVWRHRRESRNIGSRVKTSAGEQKHRRENENIGSRAETSAGE